jgi:hypothetical protein
MSNKLNNTNDDKIVVDTLEDRVSNKSVKQLIRKNYKYVLAPIFVIVILALAYFFYKDLNTAISAGNVSITKKEYTKLSNEAKSSGIKEQDVKNSISEAIKYKAIANKYNISYSQEDTKQAGSAKYQTDSANLNSWQLLSAEKIAIENKINSLSDGSKKVAFLNFPFSRYFVAGLEKNPPEYGNEIAIKADKKYAYDQANKIRTDLASGKLKIEDAVNTLRKDQRLIYGSASNGSKFYTVSENGKLYNEDGSVGVLDRNEELIISNQGNSKVSAISTSKAPAVFSGLPGYNSDNTEIAYYFYYNSGETKQDKKLYSIVQQDLKEIKVKINV